MSKRPPHILVSPATAEVRVERDSSPVFNELASGAKTTRHTTVNVMIMKSPIHGNRNIKKDIDMGSNSGMTPRRMDISIRSDLNKTSINMF